MLRRNLVPSYPIFVLTILQTIEANNPIKTVLGSYGYFYEILITGALSQISSISDIDIKYTYLSELAYCMFSNKLEVLTNSDLVNVNQKYYENYAIRISSEKMMRDLTESKILIKLGEEYKFKYNYLYYYFVARYMRDNLHIKENEEIIKEHIREMSKSVFIEDYANIMIFLSYLSKDPFIVEEMLRNAKDIYKSYKLCDLVQDVEFLGKISFPDSKVIYEDKEVQKTREENLKTKDKIEGDIKNDSFTSKGEEKERDFLKLNSAYKTLEILGQIVRNFSGSLRADVKLSLTEECYSLGLRTLKVFLSLVEDNLKEFKKIVYYVLKDLGEIKDERELENKAVQFVFFFLQITCYGLIKKISYSVGSEELGEIYKRVLDKYNLDSVSLIDISIKLDHFRNIPISEILLFSEQIKKKFFLSTLLKYLVVNHFYMFPVEYNTRQKLCSKLDIDIKNPKFIDKKSKKYHE